MFSVAYVRAELTIQTENDVAPVKGAGYKHLPSRRYCETVSSREVTVSIATVIEAGMIASVGLGEVLTRPSRSAQRHRADSLRNPITLR